MDVAIVLSPRYGNVTHKDEDPLSFKGKKGWVGEEGTFGPPKGIRDIFNMITN